MVKSAVQWKAMVNGQESQTWMLQALFLHGEASSDGGGKCKVTNMRQERKTV